MSDHEESRSLSIWAGVLNALADGGIPQFIAGPAGKAISRLIGGAADIPAALLERQAQSIRDQKDARSVIMKTIAEATAMKASAQPEILDRAMERLVHDLCRKQENREAVAQLTAEQLRIDPPPLDTEGPTDDWMNLFQRYAEDASSEHFRAIWAKILAGEIRKRGAHSPRTLQSVSTFDAEIAGLVDKTLKYVLKDVLPMDLMKEVLKFHESFALEDFGVIAMQAPFGASYKINPGEDGYGLVFSEQFVFRVKAASKEQLSLSCYLLTRVGQELATTLQVEVDPVALAHSLWSAKPKPLEVQFAKVNGRNGDQYAVGPWQNVAQG